MNWPVVGRDYNLMDLSDDVLLLVASYLPDEDKIKLIDIIPRVETLITCIKTSTRSSRKGLSFDQLIRRLPNLKKIITTTPSWCKEHKTLINVSMINQNIIKFDGFEINDIIDYIYSVKELIPSNDAHQIRKVFNYRMVDALLKKHPDLKIRLFVEMENDKDEERFVTNRRAHLIDHLELQSGYSIKYDYHSVKELIVSPTVSLDNNINHLQNVTNVTLTKCRNVDPDSLRALLKVSNLKKLNLFVSAEFWTEANYESFQLILMKPSLKQVVVKEIKNLKYDLIDTFLSCDRNDFKTFGVQTGATFSIKVKKNVITISKFVNFSLTRLINKFKCINTVKIENKNKKFIEQIRSEIVLMKESCPRNKCLLFKIQNEVIRL